MGEVICWVGIVASVISGLVVMFANSFWMGLVIAIVGALGSWIGSFTLYGFGQLIETNDTNKQLLQENNQLLEKIAAGAVASPAATPEKPSVPVMPANKAPEVKQATSTEENSPQTPVQPIKTDDPTIVCCPICKAPQRSNRSLCYNCGVPFIQDETK